MEKLICISIFFIFVLFFGFSKTIKFYKAKFYEKSCVWLYTTITMLFVSYVLFIIKLRGMTGLISFLSEGPLSNILVTLFCVGQTWLLIGSILILLERKIINKKNIFLFITFYFYSFMYLNILRERTAFGDAGDFVNAAFNLYSHQPLHFRYLYPPFFASCLQLLVPLGKTIIITTCIIANYFSLLLFFILLYLTLKKFGFSENFAVFATFIILCVNVPVLRNLGYVQINIHVANLILLSLLFYRKFIFLSALALTLAVHLKLIPIILVLPYIFNKEWKWLAYFAVSMLTIVFLSSSINSFEYYRNFISNILSYSLNPEKSFGNNSIDSFFYVSSQIFNLNALKTRYVILFLKILVLLINFAILIKTIEKRVFYNGEIKESIIYNSYIILPFLMLIMSPVIWAYHFCFLIFPFLVMLKKLSNKLECILYSIIYYLIFLVPKFYFYPFSFNRLLGIILCYILFIKFLTNHGNNSTYFKKMNHYFGTYKCLRL